RCWFIAGLLGGLALTFRPDLVIALGLVFGWVVWAHRPSWKPIVVGATVGLLPMWVHLVMAGPLAAFDGMVLDPVLRLRDGRELPRPPSWDRIDGALQAIAEEIPPWWRLPQLEVSHALFLWFFAMLAGTVALLAFAVFTRRRPHGISGRSTVLLVVALISVGILPQALQRPDSTHLTWVTCIAWPFSIVAVVEVVNRWRPRTSARRALVAGGAFALTLTFTFTALFTFRYYVLHTRIGLGQVVSPMSVTRDGRTFWFGSVRAATALQEAVDELDRLAQPGERLFVGPKDLRRTWYSDIVAYWMFPELTPATYYLEMDPGLANAPNSGLAEDVASADWVLLTGFWDGWYEPNSSIDYGSDAPNQVVREEFCTVGSYGDDLVVLLRRCR
ncbi:MAG: hypothetical protein ACRDZ2_06430, partial [Ilumatobacteraceae bacterium]